ncbi:c-type cytochrome [Rugamonas apoptosis]|uniref:C-type cytochrome n=1 Tax=Rugamonas apoptosis TaxID=2758570 RepID=A0A7W2F925_9BURK|nr:c-type cytochrome [Rugamonas apoptosis]MBA5687401.1 c-type cytochrome [Rugamonas apoptosis]
MSRFIKSAFRHVLVLALAGAAWQAQAAPAAAVTSTPTGLGRPATAAEVAAWDIDVRPDFKGLPKGAGTVAAGQVIWEGRCASCHGTFGESNEVFTPIVGGTTADDIKTGHVAALKTGRQPQKTTLMKVATVSTLWDYINRAMPWTAPKSLKTDEVYAVLAYILNMGEIVPDDFTLSDQNIAQVQQRMPNRNGMDTKHGMWDLKGKPDVHSVVCMKNCPVEPGVRSTLPEPSRNAHGNIALQNRTFGPVRGADTTKPAPAAPIGAASPVASVAAGAAANVNASAAAQVGAESAGLKLAKQNACVACHGITNKIVGPAFSDVAARYRGDAGAPAALAAKVRAGTSGTWGTIPMPAQASLKDDELQTLVTWVLAGAK